MEGRIVDDIIGANVRDVLSGEDYKGFMRSLKTAIRTKQRIPINYHLGNQRYIAIIDPIDSETVFLHEQKFEGQNENRVVNILMKMADQVA